MPTEELFGAYNVPLSDDGGTKADSFEFRAVHDAAVIDHIEVYEVRFGTRISTEGRASQAADLDDDQWIEGLPAISAIADPPVYWGRLRSDGDLVQAVSKADMSGDFIL